MIDQDITLVVSLAEMTYPVILPSVNPAHGLQTNNLPSI
jgi:hypothetical protein